MATENSRCLLLDDPGDMVTTSSLEDEGGDGATLPSGMGMPRKSAECRRLLALGCEADIEGVMCREDCLLSVDGSLRIEDALLGGGI